MEQFFFFFDEKDRKQNVYWKLRMKLWGKHLSKSGSWDLDTYKPRWISLGGITLMLA